MQRKKIILNCSLFTIISYSLNKNILKQFCFKMLFYLEAPPRFELGIKVLQTSALPLGYSAIYLERKMGFEPTTFTLARWRSTTEPLPHTGGIDQESNQGHEGFSVLCSTDWAIEPNCLYILNLKTYKQYNTIISTIFILSICIYNFQSFIIFL